MNLAILSRKLPSLLLGGFYFALFFTTTILARANPPGGGTGTGPPVTITDNKNGTITMQNGLVTALIRPGNAQIEKLTYNNIQVTDGLSGSVHGFYWQGIDQNAGEETPSRCIYTIVANPAQNGGTYAEISCLDLYTNKPSQDMVEDVDFHFSMHQGSPGIYVTQINTRPASARNFPNGYPAGNPIAFNMNCKLIAGVFDWMSEDTGRHHAETPIEDLSKSTPVKNAPKEVTLINTGDFAGQLDCKYDDSGDLGLLHVSGWSSTTKRIGFWMIEPSREYYTCGPLHRDLISHTMIILNPLGIPHYGFAADLNFNEGETWTKVHGPFFLYFNQVPDAVKNPPDALYADARAQAKAEEDAWPYKWFQNPVYVQESGRGTVTGKIVIADQGNPNASAANLWVGVAQVPPSKLNNTDFQKFAKGYQFWVKTDAGGNFTIPHVIAGADYILYAFGPGAAGTFQSRSIPNAPNPPPYEVNLPAKQFAVNVIGGMTTKLGNVTWTPNRVGSTVWEIGVPDRDAAEFRHGDDYWHADIGTPDRPAINFAPFFDYATDFPGGLAYLVGQSRWATDWSYAQPTVLDHVTRKLTGTTWKIFFNLTETPDATSAASIYMAFAADFDAPVVITVNKNHIITPPTGFYPTYSNNGGNNDAIVRMGSQGIFADRRINFDGGIFQKGLNEIDLTMPRSDSVKNGASYDYIRLELAGYIPPPPSNVTALPGNGRVILHWPAVPGATSYIVSRASKKDGTYTPLAKNVIGPVAGSSPFDATFTDSTAANGTNYFYKIASENPTGMSEDSSLVSAQPATNTATKPVAPTGLAAIAGNIRTTIHWQAVPGAAYYIVRRASTQGGPYTTLDGTITGTSFNDFSPSRGTTYYYVVAAANANGLSDDSAESKPTRVIPAADLTGLIAPPTNLTAMATGSQVSLNWKANKSATYFIIKRSPISGGPYTVIDDNVTDPKFTDPDVVKGVSYYYVVVAADEDNASLDSNEASAIIGQAGKATAKN